MKHSDTLEAAAASSVTRNGAKAGWKETLVEVQIQTWNRNLCVIWCSKCLPSFLIIPFMSLFEAAAEKDRLSCSSDSDKHF